MKRDVINLDDKIRTFKNFIQAELTSTASKEEELAKAVCTYFVGHLEP